MLHLRPVLGLVCLAVAAQQQPAPPKPAPAPITTPQITRAASLRNENVQANRIDNDALKLNNVRLGTSVTLVPAAPVEAGYFATEHGRAPSELSVVRAPAALKAWHADLYEYLKNSIFNARTFFQVGDVLPSRQNQYGARVSGPVAHLGALTGTFQQTKSRGMVNGNVLVPLANERTPLSPDPAVRSIVQRFLNAYPATAPNRPDFDLRALNTNSPQRIDELDASLRLDRNITERDRVFLFHSLNRQRIQAFQLVAGQNPDTDVHSHRTRATWRRDFSPATDASFGFGFSRVMSDLRPEPNAVGPRIRIGYQVEELGPDSQFPIHRALNTFRWGSLVAHRRGSHTITAGGDIIRVQLNGVETSNSRGVFWFTNNFGRGALDNLRVGAPSLYEGTIGPMHRGFRNWSANFFLADQWKITRDLQIYFGVRYNADSVPVEVNGLDTLPYGCDCNNFGPRFAIAWNAPAGWTVRSSYSVSHGQILPVTYAQVRYNLPLARYVQIQNPDLLNPLAGVDLADPRTRTSPTFISPDLATPYTHQYNFSAEHQVHGAVVRLAYIGSRTLKMLDSYIGNRAVPVAGVPLTTATVDQRRPDPRYWETKYILNGGIAYLDAAQLSIEVPFARGLGWGATYTFGKAIDTGTDYSATAANGDLAKGRPQSDVFSYPDRKGLSPFDSTHAFLTHLSWDLPQFTRWSAIGAGWQLSTATLMKTGTPLTLYIGSDAPGFGNVDGGPGDRPNIVDPSILGMTIGHPDAAPLILSRDRFAYLAPDQHRGSLGRNTFRKGGIANVNAALAKTWRPGGNGKSVTFRAEAYNLANHPQFDEPQRNLSSPAFGKITNTLNDGRIMQLSLRLSL